MSDGTVYGKTLTDKVLDRFLALIPLPRLPLCPTDTGRCTNVYTGALVTLWEGTHLSSLESRQIDYSTFFTEFASTPALA